MKYAEFLKKTSFTQRELIGLTYGTSVEDPPESWALLPTPPMLMLDRITKISHEPHNQCIIGEQDIRLDHWFFNCHFRGDPVQPGCLGVDAVWQLLGLYCSSAGAYGIGRALGCKEVSFFGQIRPHNRVVRYEINIRRYQKIIPTNTCLVIGSAKIFVDDEHVYNVTDAKVGMFLGINYSNYPFQGPNAFGGATEK